MVVNGFFRLNICFVAKDLFSFDLIIVSRATAYQTL